MEHTQECKQLTAVVAIIRERYELLYPGHCRDCNGAGGFHDCGSYWEPPSFDLCDCLENGRCPRCGKTIDSEICPACGWDENEPDVKPDLGILYPCPCEIAEQNKYWEEEHRRLLNA